MTQSLSTVEAIKSLVETNTYSDINNSKKLDLFLCSWWSEKFNRPLKDPILQSYTTEELLYEYYNHIERRRAEAERLEEESDKIEDDKLKESLDWAEAEEKRDLERLKQMSEDKAISSEENEEFEDPMMDPNNREWVEKELQKAKELHGDDFGENVEMNFTD